MIKMKILILTTSATQKAVIRHPTIFCVQSHQIYTVSLSRRTSLSELLHIVFRKLQLFSNSRFVNSRWLGGRSLTILLYIMRASIRFLNRVKNLI